MSVVSPEQQSGPILKFKQCNYPGQNVSFKGDMQRFFTKLMKK